MKKLVALTGNGAAAEAMRQIDPDVVAAFPITPSTQIMEDFAQFHADGRVKTELVTVESEHSAMSACIGAAAAGGRVMTATSSNGLALMWEMLYIAASMRQPVLLTLVNRALSGPINIHCDHADAMGARDAGWIQVFAENNQELYDNLIMAPRICVPALPSPIIVIRSSPMRPISNAADGRNQRGFDHSTIRSFVDSWNRNPSQTEHRIIESSSQLLRRNRIELTGPD